MQFEWIIVLLVAVSIGCNNASPFSPPHPAADLDNRDIMRLWAATLQAINEAELQRKAPAASSSPVASASAPVVSQRSNSKRLSWRNNSKLLNEEQEQEEEDGEEYLDSMEGRQNTYSSLSQPPEVNPAYIDVKDYTPAPPTWWF
ncbi:hypothetical protein KR044_010002 [Drosophila immigrans]|nr:hypothetical protein KR044_010002 [Drosophila immigrans]